MTFQPFETNSNVENLLQGRFEFFHTNAIYSPLSKADFLDTKQNSFYVSGMEYAPCNGIIEKDIHRSLSEEEIKQALDYFSKKKLPFIWWSASTNLEQYGLQYGGILTGIAMDVSQNLPKNPQASEQLKIKICKSEADLDIFTSLAADGFAASKVAQEQWVQINQAVMEKGEQIHFLAFVNDKPVGTLTLSTCKLSAGIWNLTTLPEYRNQGVASQLVHAALTQAKELNYQQVMAILMPKGMAWGLFTKLGFQEVCEFPFYVYGANAEELEK